MTIIDPGTGLARQTPQISAHARQRCAEMGLTTKIAKRIWRHQTLTRPDPQGRPNRRFVTSTSEPACALIVDVTTTPAPTVITVLWHSYTPFTREPASQTAPTVNLGRRDAA